MEIAVLLFKFLYVISTSGRRRRRRGARRGENIVRRRFGVGKNDGLAFVKLVHSSKPELRLYYVGIQLEAEYCSILNLNVSYLIERILIIK